MTDKLWHDWNQEKPTFGDYILAELSNGVCVTALVPDEYYLSLNIKKWCLIKDIDC